MSQVEGHSQHSLSQETSHSTVTETQNTARFYACYLLVSLSPLPRSKNKTYIGFTVAPQRRLRQHNGDLIAGGAKQTKSHRPWMMVCVIHGFADKTQALQFEWAWQHSRKTMCLKSHFDRPDALALPSTGIASVNGRLQALAALTSVPPWSLCPLTLTVSAERSRWTEYKIDEIVFPLPLRVNFSPITIFDSSTYNYRQRQDAVVPQGDCCAICKCEIEARGESVKRVSHCPSCGCRMHIICQAKRRDADDYVGDEKLLPNYVRCASCDARIHWSLVIRICRALETDDD